VSGQGRRLAAGWPGWAVAVVWLSAGQAFAQPEKHLDPLSWDRNVQKLFRTHCYDCHNTEDANGGIDLERDADPRLIRGNRDTWLGVVHVLTSGEMPPADADPQPTEEDRQLMVQFLEQTLASLNCDSGDDPGPPPLRRLNRTEYDNAVTDLVGLELGLGASFPPDPSSFGFDNIGPALSFSPVQLEQYHAAARKAVAAVRATRLTAPDVYARIFGGPDETDAASARPLIRRLAEQAFRRPLADAQLDRLMAIYEQSRATEDHETALGHVLTAVLISPHFLIRLEHNREAATEPYRIDDHELASRLGFSSGPGRRTRSCGRWRPRGNSPNPERSRPR
jgi:mono/diheme cytochrome c family protein